MRNFKNSILIAYPIYLAVTLILMAIFAPSFLNLKELGKFIVFNYPNLEIPFLNITLDNLPLEILPNNPVIFLILAGLLLLWVPFRDHSNFLLHSMDLIASFDDEGVTQRVEALPKSISGKYRIHPNWKDERSKFFHDMDLKIVAAADVQLDFSDTENLSGHGDISFDISHFGILQDYRMSNGKGILELSKSGTTNPLVTYFKLLDLNSSIFHISLFDIFIRGGFYISPVFEQTYVPKPAAAHKVFSILTCITEIKIIPFIVVGDTLYLKKGEDGYFIPLGYCKYFAAK